jgi:hypothetical protein
MNPDEYERLKEEEKAHLRKVRALKEQLQHARRQEGLHKAIRGLDTSGLDAEFEQALRDVESQNLTAEARYELAMGALDDAAERERQRLEEERFDAERRQAAASDLVRRMKSELSSDAPGAGRSETKTTSEPAKPEEPSTDPPAADSSSKTIGRPRAGG